MENMLKIMKTQELIINEAMRLLYSISEKHFSVTASEVKNSKLLTQNKTTMKHIVNAKNDFIDSMYFFMMDYLIYMVCKDS